MQHQLSKAVQYKSAYVYICRFMHLKWSESESARKIVEGTFLIILGFCSKRFHTH